MKLNSLFSFDKLVLIFKVIIPVLALWLVWEQIHTIQFQQIAEVLTIAKWQPLLLGGATMFAAIFVMGFYDVWAFQIDGEQKLSFTKRWLIGAMTFGWSNLIGFGPAIRAWLYARYNYTLAELGRGLLLHYSISFLGLVAWAVGIIIIGGGLIGYFVTPLVLSIVFSAGYKFIAPKLPFTDKVSLADVPLSVYVKLAVITYLDWGLTLMAFVLVVSAFGFSELGFSASIHTAIYGWVVGIASMVPGGIGTADAIWLHQFDTLLNNPEAGAALVFALRLIIYIIPWVAAALAFYAFALVGNAKVLRIQRLFLAIILGVQSLLLLLSVATPFPLSHLEAIADILPLHFIESSHLISTVLGFSLLLLLRGINKGYRNAYHLALLLLSLCLISNIINGFDLLAFSTTLFTLLVLFLSKREFTREGRFNIGFTHTLVSGLLGLTFLWIMGFIAFENVPYRPDLWQQFEVHMQASRFLRSAAVVTIFAMLFAVRQALRPQFHTPAIQTSDIQKVERFAQEHSLEPDSLLVAGGDKYIWWHEDQGFILYQVRDNKLLVFKNPQLAAGNDPKVFVQAFMNFCEAADLEPYFSGVSANWMEHLHEFGFYFTKIAEEAVVNIDSYSLQGGSKSAFRRTIKVIEKQGIVFEVAQPPFSAETVQQLRDISDIWVSLKGGHELQFNACYFSPAYVQRNPIAIAKDESGKIIAFANLLMIEGNGSARIDFMRYKPGDYDNLMDYVLIKSIVHLANQGYKAFSLGDAPMTDVGNTDTARSIEKLMLRVSEHAERFYNYKGLRFFKGKFKPDWQARFMAYRYPWNSLTTLRLSVSIVQARAKPVRERIACAKFAEDYDQFQNET